MTEEIMDPEVLKEIKDSGQLNDELKKKLNKAFGEFKLAHKELFAKKT